MSNKDRRIYNIEHLIIDVVAELQNTGKVEIFLNYEGPCARSLGLYDLLDHICRSFNVNKNLITVRTHNYLEKHSEYNVVIEPNQWITGARQHAPISIPSKQTQLKTVGFFSGRTSWYRMILGAWLFNNYRDQTLMSFNYRHVDDDKFLCELDELNFFKGDNLEEAVCFLKHTPIILDDMYYYKQIHTNDVWVNVNGNSLYNYYDQIFLELVTETYVTGVTFCPTEKTIRTILAKTPFIVFGAVGYLENLRRIGFKTFSQWWDESYDTLEGADRIDAIKRLISEIMSWPQDIMCATIVDMREILDYNRTHFMTMNLNEVPQW
jgi:hypothetical protein